MNSFATGLFLLTMLCFSPVIATIKQSNIYTVMDEIFDGYKPYARPVKSSATVTIVHVSFNLMSINSVDEKPQTMSQSLYLRLHWIDEHLAWNPSEHGGLDSLIVPQDKIWLPDIIISPFAGKMQRLGYNELPVVVESSGQISWQPSGVFTTRCAMDITFYPFDKQFCQLRLELWASSTRDAILTLSELRPVIRDNLVENSEWELVDVIPEQKNETLSDETVNSIVMLSYTLRRRPMFVTLTVVLPTVLLALLSTLVFALPAESGQLCLALWCICILHCLRLVFPFWFLVCLFVCLFVCLLLFCLVVIYILHYFRLSNSLVICVLFFGVFVFFVVFALYFSVLFVCLLLLLFCLLVVYILPYFRLSNSLVSCILLHVMIAFFVIFSLHTD